MPQRQQQHEPQCEVAEDRGDGEGGPPPRDELDDLMTEADGRRAPVDGRLAEDPAHPADHAAGARADPARELALPQHEGEQHDRGDEDREADERRRDEPAAHLPGERERAEGDHG